MMNNENKKSNLIIDLVTKWEESLEIGLHITPKDVCQDNPELEDIVTKQITKLKRMRWLTSSWDSNSSENLPNGTLIADRFRIEGVLGAGGFGTVYKAFDNQLFRPVAIKIANLIRSDPDALLAEARKAASLHHPHIITVHDVGRHEGRVFIVSQLVEGRSLREVASGKKIASVQAAQWMTQVAEALSVAHDKGLVHRDLKPSNIIIETNQQAMVSDFGIAFYENEVHEIEPSTGTLAYMSPEQVQADSICMGPKTDIFSFGIVLYELLSGKHPFHNKVDSKTLKNIVEAKPTPLTGTPPVLQKLCEQCLSISPENRPNATEVAKRLREFLVNDSGSKRFKASSSFIIFTLFIMAVGSGWVWWQYLSTNSPKNSDSTASISQDHDQVQRKFPSRTEVSNSNIMAQILGIIKPLDQTLPSNQSSVLLPSKGSLSADKQTNSVNLIQLIEPSRHTVRGLWTKSNGLLNTVSPTGTNESLGGAIQIDYRPNSAYTLTIRARRFQNGGIIVPVVFSGRQFGVYLAAGWSGSKIPEARPIVEFEADFFPTKDWHIVTVYVGPEGIQCKGDSGANLKWQADYASVEGRPYDIPDDCGLYLKIWGKYEIDTLTIEEHSK